MKVLHIVSALNGGGVEKTIYNIMPPMIEKGYRFDFIVLSGVIGIFEENIKKYNSNIYHITPKRKNYLQHIKEIKNIIKNGNYDIVHCHLAEKGFWFYHYASKYSDKTIMHTHGCWNELGIKQKIRKNILLKLCSKKANVYCSCSVNSAKYVFGQEYEKSIILKNSFDIEKYVFDVDNRKEVRDALKITDDEIVVGMVARLSGEKNHALAMRLMKQLNNVNGKYKLLLVGDGPCFDQLKALAAELKIEDSVIFLGNRKDAQTYYSAMDIYVQPSIHEGFGMSLVEAQINGLYCITSQYITNEALILKGKCLKADIHSLDEWASTIRSIEMGYNRRVDITRFDDFSVDNIKDEYAKIYEQK